MRRPLLILAALLWATVATAQIKPTPGGGASGANANGTYIVQTAANKPTNAQVLASLGTGVVLNTTTTGVLSIFGGTSCTNQVVLSLSASAAASCTTITSAFVDATIPTIAAANVFSSATGISMKKLLLPGSSSGTLTVLAAAAAGSSTLTLPGGTTDFSATGGTNQLVKQASAGAALTVGTVATTNLSDVSTGTWTPADGSGAGLSLTTGTSAYISIGGLTCVQLDLAYPANASGATAQISGLPVNTTATGGRWSYTVGFNNSTVSIDASSNTNSASILMFNAASGAAITNVILSGATLRISGCYRTN